MAAWQLSIAVLMAWLLAAPEAKGPLSCKEVRASFHALQPGVRWVPESPVSGSDLQVCVTKSSTCCSKKMEERYQMASRVNMEQLIQAASAKLKFLIIQNAAIFQDAFEMVIRHARNYTNSMFKTHYQNIALKSFKLVGELFTDVSLYVLGSDINVNDMVNEFFDGLFPVVYGNYLNPGFKETVENVECLRLARRDVHAFGHYPKMIMTQVSKSLQASRVFLQALNLGIEVINTTDYLKFNKDCGRTLVKMWYCSHCQGHLFARPCAGFCGTVMQGCLASVVDIDPYWNAYISSIERLAKEMHGIYDLERVLLNLYSLIRDAVVHVERNRGKLSTLVSKLCSTSKQRVSRSLRSGVLVSVGKKVFRAGEDNEETLSGKRREFIRKLKAFSHFYGTLPSLACRHSTISDNDTSCWNGHDLVDRFNPHTVKNGLKVQTGNQEAKGRSTEPVINQIIDKLNHVNQLLKGMSTQRRKSAGGSIPGEEESQSGDCDDEDECEGGSGKGGLRIRNQLRLIPDMDEDLDMDDVPFTKPIRNHPEQSDRDTPYLQSGSSALQTGPPGRPLLALAVTLLGLLWLI